MRVLIERLPELHARGEDKGLGGRPLVADRLAARAVLERRPRESRRGKLANRSGRPAALRLEPLHR